MLVKEILEATKGRLLKGDINASFSGISIDSRTIKKGNFFIALKGENFDGHNFIKEAIRKKAKGVVQSPVTSQPKTENSPFIIQVADTTKALGDIASCQRRKFAIPVIAISGSNGKTTLKELIALLLSSKYKVLKNKENWNNCIGLSLTLLELNFRHQAVVVEMGTNHFGELKRLSEIAQPTIAVITNIGSAHLQFFKNIKGVYKAKTEFLEDLSSDRTVAIDSADEHLLSLVRKKFRGEIVFFDAVSAASAPSRFLDAKIISAAFVVCERFNISRKEMLRKLKHFKNLPMRMEMQEIKGVSFINDAYNSNPSSLLYAIQRLSECKGRKILVVGDMLELGERSQELHFEIGGAVVKAKIDILISVGELAKKISEGACHYGMDKKNMLNFNSNLETAECILSILKKGDTILVKGSRKMRMEEIIEKIKDFLAPGSKPQASNRKLQATSFKQET